MELMEQYKLPFGVHNAKIVKGVYGSSKISCNVFVIEAGDGNWYCCERSQNVNLTLDEINDGCWVEDIGDIYYMYSAKEICSLNELLAFIFK